MALSPQSIREQQFKSARRGYDQDEVEAFRTEVADALESAQNEATAMEARARAAVARLQELSKAQPAEGDAASTPSPAPVAAPTVAPDEAETISRTLLLAQRTADTTVAEAQAEAERVLAQARDDAAARVAQAESEATTMVDAAKEDARRAGEDERVRVEGEVQALLARRDFLESDVDHLEQFLAAQRERITEAVSELGAIVQRVPNGLADMRRPLLSAAGDKDTDDADDPDVGDPDGGELAAITSVAEADADVEEPPAGVDETGDVWAARDDGSDATPHEGETLLPADERA